MKCSMRVGFAALLIAFIVALAGSAWADTNSVANNINNYFGTTAATVSGSTITVSGTKNDASGTLALGDISGLTVEWGATLTGDFSDLSNGRGNIALITMSGTGTFNINEGAEIKVRGTENNSGRVYLIRVQDINGNPVFNVNGGTLEALMPNAFAIDTSSDNFPLININGGTINVPRGMVAAGDVKVSNAANVIGMVVKVPQQWVDGADAVIEFYGECSVVTDFGDDNEHPIGNVSWHIMPNATATVIEGLTWSIYNNNWTLQNDGVLNINGTLINLDKVVNNGTINNYSSNTLDNQGTLTNNKTINNESNGIITNTGIIDNANGKIINNGTIANSGTIKSDTANFEGNVPTGNPLQPINDNTGGGGDGGGDDGGSNGGSGGGGCNAGFGMFGLLFAGLVALKHRKA